MLERVVPGLAARGLITRQLTLPVRRERGRSLDAIRIEIALNPFDL